MVIDLSYLYGVLTGLLPSLHPNNLVNFVPNDQLLKVALIHSFINFIPNILFLVPDIYTISSLNASQILYKEGRAYFSLLLSVFLLLYLVLSL